MAFRRFWGAVLPLVALLIGVVWVIGLMAMVGRAVTIATVSLPTVLIAVGGSYAFHVLNQHRISIAAAGQDDHDYAWMRGLRFILPAVLVSGLTTIAGFGALSVSSVPTVRDMGIFNAAGVAIMLALTLCFIPAVLAVFRVRMVARRPHASGDYARWLNRILKTVTALVLHRRRATFILVMAVTAIQAVWLLELRVNTDYLSLFPSKSDTVQSAEKLHERIAGASVVQIVVDGGPGAVYEPVFLRSLLALEQFALSHDKVDSAVSIADIVARIGALVHDDGASAEPAAWTPDTREQTERLFREFLLGDSSVTRLVNLDRGAPSRAIVVLRTHLFSSAELHELSKSLGIWVRDNLPEGMTARLTGSAMLLNNASDAIARSQILSLSLALLTIYLVMTILFRSFRTAALALAPNLLPIIGFFGFLGLAGIPLDMTTSLIATAALGLAVDNAVHMIRRYRAASAESRDQAWALWLTMLRTGKPMILANLMLIAAFLIFMLFSFVPVRIGGLLWAVTIAACLVSNLVLLPILMTRVPARSEQTRNR
jgi:predicted RND superfamily exporter protein